MRADLRANAILQWRNDLAARGVILRVRREDQQHVQGQPQRIALNLNVAFLHDVEQPDLNFSRQVRQFVDGKNPAIGSRQQPVVNRQFVGKIAPAARRANGVDVSDDVRDGHVRRGQLLHKPLLSRHPRERRVIAFRVDSLPARPANRLQRVVIDFAPRDDRHFGVQQLHQPAQDSALGLSAQTQKDEIVPRQQCVDDLRDHRVFVAVHTGK